MGKKINDEQLINELLICKSQKEVAQKLHITEATVSRRLQDVEFKSKFAEYRSSILDTTTTRLVATADKAVSVLEDLLMSDKEHIRFTAATKILQLTQDYIMTTDINMRLQILEQDNNNYL